MPTNNTNGTNNPNDVELNVQDFWSNEDGWTNVTGSNDLPYSYKYTGGDGPTNNGKVTFERGWGLGVINLSLVAKERYKFLGEDCITFKNDPGGQLDTHGGAPRSRVIKDKCTTALDARYKVLVTDTGTNPNATIPCDPPVINNPN